MKYTKEDFGRDFKWGISTAAYQVEGAHDSHGKGPSIWDTFTQKRKKIAGNHHCNIACDFYNRYTEDILLLDHKHPRIPFLHFMDAYNANRSRAGKCSRYRFL
jgi:beta-glucosidase